MLVAVMRITRSDTDSAAADCDHPVTPLAKSAFVNSSGKL